MSGIFNFINDLFGLPPENSRTGKPRPRPPQAQSTTQRPVHKPQVQLSGIDRFLALGRRAVAYVDIKSHRKPLQGVLIRNGKMYGTNGHIAFVAKVDEQINDVILPVSFFKSKWAPGQIKTMGVTPDKKLLVINGQVTTFETIPGIEYPQIENVLPKKFMHGITLDRGKMMAAVMSLRVIGDKKAVLRFDPRPGNVLQIKPLTSERPVTTQAIRYFGNPLKEPFALNIDYLLRVLHDLPGNSVRLRFNTTIGAFMLDSGNAEVSMLIMPVRIQATEEALRQAA